MSQRHVYPFCFSLNSRFSMARGLREIVAAWICSLEAASLAAFGRSCLHRVLKAVFPTIAVPGIAGAVRFVPLLDELVEGHSAETRSHQRQHGCLNSHFRSVQQRLQQRQHPWQQRLGCTQKVSNHNRPPGWSIRPRADLLRSPLRSTRGGFDEITFAVAPLTC